MIAPRRLADGFFVAPQIQPADAATLAGQGFVAIVNNRPDGEEPGQPDAQDIEKAAKAVGLLYRAIPVAGGFADPQVASLREFLDEAHGPVLAFCRTGTRSTLLWALAQASRGEDTDSIAAAATQAGYDITPVRAAIHDLAARG